MLSLDEFNRWVAEHGPVLHTIAYRMVGNGHLAEDLVQETFASAWKGRERYDAYTPEVNPRAWLCAILRRRVADYYRKPAFPALVENVECLVEDRASDEFSDEVQEALDSLPLVFRQAILWISVGELTHKEAAAVAGVTIGTMLSRYSRAREHLRAALSKKRRLVAR